MALHRAHIEAPTPVVRKEPFAQASKAAATFVRLKVPEFGPRARTVRGAEGRTISRRGMDDALILIHLVRMKRPRLPLQRARRPEAGGPIEMNQLAYIARRRWTLRSQALLRLGKIQRPAIR